MIELIKTLKGQFSNKQIYEALQIPKTTFYRWLNTPPVKDTSIQPIIDICLKNYQR